MSHDDAVTVRRAYEVWNESGPTIRQGGTTDTPYTDSFAVVHRLRDGLIVEADYYLDRAAALEAVGLRE